MAQYQKRAVIASDVQGVFHQPPEAEQELLCTYLDDTEPITVYSNMLTLVMNRNIRKTVELSAEMSVFLAKKFPERHFLLVNTYAGTDLMQRSLARGLAACGFKIPANLARHVGPDYAESIAEDSDVSFPPNLRVLACETGTFDVWRIEEEKKIFGCDAAIINSFEYSTYDDRERRRLAASLLELRQQTDITLVIFSHEMRADVNAYTPARGPIGIMSAHAGSVWRIMTQFDRARYNNFYRRIADATKNEWKNA